MSKTSVSILQEWAAKEKFGMPEYELVNQRMEKNCHWFTYRVTCRSVSAEGSGLTKKDAKQIAAREFLKLFSKAAKQLPVNGLSDSSRPDPDNFINSVGKLNEYCLENSLKSPEYDLVNMGGPAHDRAFTMICKIGNLAMQATSSTKKQAKQDVAGIMLDKLVRETPHRNNETIKINEHDLNMFKRLSLNAEMMEKQESVVTELYSKLPRYSNKPHKSISTNVSEGNDFYAGLRKSITADARRIIADLIRECIDGAQASVLDAIADTLGFTVSTKEISSRKGSVAVLTKLNSEPVIHDIGIGDTYRKAKEQSIKHLLNSINILLI